MKASPRAPQSSFLDLGGFTGLTENEAQLRLEREGPNELPAREERGLTAIAWEVVKEPMFLMLVSAGALYLLMGEPKDALMLLGFVFVVMGITIVQERRTEHALEALRDLSSPGRWSSATAGSCASQAVKWCPGTSSWSPRGIGCPQTPSCAPASTCRWTNPC